MIKELFGLETHHRTNTYEHDDGTHLAQDTNELKTRFKSEFLKLQRKAAGFIEEDTRDFEQKDLEHTDQAEPIGEYADEAKKVNDAQAKEIEERIASGRDMTEI